MNLNIPCITCRRILQTTLRPTGKTDFYYCSDCSTCYQYISISDIFGTKTEYLNPVSSGQSDHYNAEDDGVNYYTDTADSTSVPEYYTTSSIHDKVKHLPPPQIEHKESSDFEEELSIIKKSNTVKEFLKNSLYLEKPYDK